MMIGRNIVFLALVVCAVTRAQDYPDYQDYANDYEDNLYQGYAERQEQKAVG